MCELQSTRRTLHDALEAIALLLGHRVPELGRAKVNVVDRVEVRVLDVPRERCAPHAKVEVR